MSRVKRSECQTIAFLPTKGHIDTSGGPSYSIKGGKPQFQLAYNAKENNPYNTRVVKKKDFGKIVDERKNYRLYVSGVGYVDEAEVPKPKPAPVLKRVVKETIPVMAPPPEPPKEPEMETVTKVSIEKISDGDDPDWKFTNLGVTAKQSEEGKKVFYRVIEAVPEGECYAEFKKITRTYRRPKGQKDDEEKNQNND